MRSKNRISSPDIRGSSTRPPLRRHPLTLTSIFIFILLATINCQKITHYQTQPAFLEEKLANFMEMDLEKKRGKQKYMALFLKKCSSCHQASRALSVIKDKNAWETTINRMQYYSDGAITKNDEQMLVELHVSQQQDEIENFKKTCTKCHDDERITRRSMSVEQWLETIKRMQEKSPALITDEKIILLSAYFHRRELTMARIFNGKCELCHRYDSESMLAADYTKQLEGLKVIAYGEFGENLQIRDFNSLLSNHVERQKNEMLLYENNCNICHVGELPTVVGATRNMYIRKTRGEWIVYIGNLIGVELTRESKENINMQIGYHILHATKSGVR